MADKKISALTSVTTPLAGTEVLPIVQSSSTKNVTVDNLTKGRTVNATTFDTDVAAAGVTLTGTTLAADGTDTNIGINITPKGTGAVSTKNLLLTDGVANAVPYLNASKQVLGDINLQFDGSNFGIGRAPAHKLDVNGAARINSTIGVGNATPATTGAGVTFPATISASSDANTLDDYEEGTWTPAIGYTTPGDSSFSFSYQDGTYVKVGQLVTVTFLIRISSLTKGTASGDWQIQNLPFAAFTRAEMATFGNVMYYDAPCSVNNQVTLLPSGATFMIVRVGVNNAGWAAPPDLDSDSQVFGTITYRSA